MTMKIGMIGCGNISPVYLTYLGQKRSRQDYGGSRCSPGEGARAGRAIRN
ncbi:hypothetical protein [Paenibacillus macerans]|nr:hypothetical protein [Paenibacillus macerans]MCM3698343.1 hypothetical protein [Paenibacillus macerans]